MRYGWVCVGLACAVTAGCVSKSAWEPGGIIPPTVTEGTKAGPQSIPRSPVVVVRLSAPTAVFPSSVEATATATIENRTSVAVSFDRRAVEDPVLALDVRDAQGNPVRTVPPSLPPQRPETLIVQPGGSVTQVYSLNIFSPPLAEGRYTVKARLAGVTSEVLEFRIGKP